MRKRRGQQIAREDKNKSENGFEPLTKAQQTCDARGMGRGAAKQLTKREAISKSEVTQEYCILSGKKDKDGNEEKVEKKMENRGKKQTE